MSGPGDSPNCPNCGAHLTGQYCGQCGQRAVGRFISIWQLLRDAFGDLLELDSRLWRTMIPLLIRPGLLTKDYLEGRRARYMPPFRMYLVLSLVFFIVAFFDPQDKLAVFYEPAPEATEVLSPPGISQEELDEAHEETRRAIEELIDEGVLDPEWVPPEYREQAEVSDEGSSPDETLANDEPVDDEEDGDGIHVTIDDDDFMGSCTLGEFDMGDSPEWLKRRMTPQRLKSTCEQIKAAGWNGFRDAIVDNIPAGLIILLPFVALILKMLYPLSRRYYVEHLLFFIHFHSFFFLLLSLQILLSRLGAWIGFAAPLFAVVLIAAAFYIPVYLFVAMRQVYGQGRFVTILKYIWLVFWYVLGFMFVMMSAVLLAAFSV